MSLFRETFAKGFTSTKLRALLGLFFLALAVPTAALIWHAYGQLKWEAFHQHRGMAEELTKRIDANLMSMVKSAESRSFADYTFLVVAGDPSANFIQRSPLSGFPVDGDLAGSLGYFQVDADGTFSTPLLPQDGTAANTLGIGTEEFRRRRELENELRAVLSDNRLIDDKLHRLERNLVNPATPAVAGARPPEKDAEFGQTTAGIDAPSEESTRLNDLAAGDRAAAKEQEGKLDTQRAFDELNKSRSVDDAYDDDASLQAISENETQSQRQSRLGRVADLNLDSVYRQKIEKVESEAPRTQSDNRSQAPARVSRKEQISVPEPSQETGGGRPADTARGLDLRISTFESEIDPLEFSLLDSGHFVLFRRVWRGGERRIQGLLIDQREFLEQAIKEDFRSTALFAMSDLIVAYQDDVVDTVSGTAPSYVTRAPQELSGALLYRNRLSAPLDGLELIFSVNRLPPGQGAGVLAWVTLVLALVLCGGFFALYRAGLRQIALVRQQQDFVSAVTHELKTPLTSIRMYGEMLKEGWADDEKKQDYYEYIHDESERLTRLISNVLQLANITHNDQKMDLRSVAVGDLLKRVEAKVSSQIQNAGFEVDFSSDNDTDVALIDIDDDCFTQIIINLVDNAIKFSRHADIKRIDISSRLTRDDRVVFSVRDYGPGVPKDQMKKIFDMFFRSESELTRETVGTGIGLAIVHHLSRAMAAGVDVLNRNPGAEFQLSFPLHHESA